jgi:F420-dependent oxidoreductase-like protein
MDKVSFGMFAPQGWKMELASVADPAAKWAKTKEVALAAEAAGYDSIWVYDHFHNIPPGSQDAVFECWSTMAALAEATSTIRLGQMVSCAPYRSPALVAKITSTIDVISGGRLEWGVGAGWYEREFAAYGYEFPAPKVRIGMMRETVEIVKAMWAESRTTYEGRHFTIHGAQCDPKPLQAPHPPVWIGGAGPQLTLRVVARLADKSNFGGNPGEWAAKCEILKRRCAEVGRDEGEIEKTWTPEVVVRATEAELQADREAGRIGPRYGELYESWVAGNLVGTPEQVSEKIARYVELGCTYFVPWSPDYPSTETLELFGREVIPNFR